MILEMFFDLYVNIAEKFSASGKLKKWQENLLRVLCAIVFLAIFALIPFGICLVTAEESSHTLGIAMLAIGISFLLIHITVALCISKREEHEDLREIEDDAKELFESNEPEPILYTMDEEDLKSENGNIDPPTME